jgi:hypothetical protein
MGGGGYLTKMLDRRNAYKTSVGKPEGTRSISGLVHGEIILKWILGN